MNVSGKRNGETFENARDRIRLNRQASAVYDLMVDGAWRSLGMIADMTGEPQASISARLRDFRKKRFGSHVVDRKHLAGGVWLYRVLPPEPAEEVQLELLEAAE